MGKSVMLVSFDQGHSSSHKLFNMNKETVTLVESLKGHHSLRWPLGHTGQWRFYSEAIHQLHTPIRSPTQRKHFSFHVNRSRWFLKDRGEVMQPKLACNKTSHPKRQSDQQSDIFNILHELLSQHSYKIRYCGRSWENTINR